MTTTRSASNQTENVVSRIRRSPRAAAVDARRRISEMAAEAFEEQQPSTYVRPTSTQASALPSMNHRYMLRSMRRQEQ
jgi:hypothetical protein